MNGLVHVFFGRCLLGAYCAEGNQQLFLVYYAVNPQESSNDLLDTSCAIGVKGGRNVVLMGMLDLAAVLDLSASMGRQLLTF